MTRHEPNTVAGDVPDPVHASVASYSANAAEYAVQHASKMAERIQDFAAWLPERAQVLDAGCGPGRDLARFNARGHRPTGLELNPTFVAMARKHAATVHSDLRELGALFPHRSFDGIWACAALVHLSRAAAADVLAQFARLLVPDGKLYVAVPATGASGWCR